MRDEELVFLIPVIAITSPMLLIAFIVFCKCVSNVLCHWRDVSLKMRMVEAGLSPSEIEQVIAAGRPLKNRVCGKRNQQQMAGMTAAIDKPPVKVGV